MMMATAVMNSITESSTRLLVLNCTSTGGSWPFFRSVMNLLLKKSPMDYTFSTGDSTVKRVRTSCTPSIGSGTAFISFENVVLSGIKK